MDEFRPSSAVRRVLASCVTTLAAGLLCSAVLSAGTITEYDSLLSWETAGAAFPNTNIVQESLKAPTDMSLDLNSGTIVNGVFVGCAGSFCQGQPTFEAYQQITIKFDEPTYGFYAMGGSSALDWYLVTGPDSVDVISGGFTGFTDSTPFTEMYAYPDAAFGPTQYVDIGPTVYAAIDPTPAAITAAPEPASLALTAVSALAMLLIRKKARSASIPVS